jgi:hypothetical protein
MNPTSYLFGSRFACAQTVIFSGEPCSKYAGETSIVLWITACEKRIPTSCNPKQNRAANAPVNRKAGFYADRDVIEQAGGWIHFCMKQLRTLKSFQNIQV